MIMKMEGSKYIGATRVKAETKRQDRKREKGRMKEQRTKDRG
jgi:hypothetical protein